MTRYHIKADMPETYTSITLTPELEALVQDNTTVADLEREYEAPVRKAPSFLSRIASGALIALMAALPYVAGCGPSNGNDGDAVNPMPTGYSVSDNMTPGNGTSVGPDDSPLEVGVDTPAVSDECSADAECSAAAEAGMDVDITATADNGTADTSDDDTQTIVSHTGVPFGSYTSGDLDLDSFHGDAGLQDGEQVTLEATLVGHDADGNPHELRGSVNVVYEEGSVDRAVVEGCYNTTASVGLALGIECFGHDPLGRSLIGQWTLTSDLAGANINPTGHIGAGRQMEESDVGLHTYTVTVLDSDEYTFTIPVDEHRSTLVLHCSDGTNHEMLLQETSVDAVASTCGTGYNPSLKPSSSADADYVLDVDEACVTGALSSLPAAEREAHQNYNDGVTPEEVYSTCTVDFAQVMYESDN